MGEKQKKYNLDSLVGGSRKVKIFDLPLARFVAKYKNSSVLFSRHGRTESFFTQDSKLYITPAEYRKIEKGERIVRVSSRLDSAISRNFEKTKIYSIGQGDVAYLNIKKRYASLRNYLSDLITGSVQGVSVVKMWNLSIVGAVIFGMLTMTMVYKYLGQNVSDAILETGNSNQVQQVADVAYAGNNVIDVSNSNKDMSGEIDTAFVTKLLENVGEKANTDFEQELREMVKGYPIEDMVPEIAKQDRVVAAFIVAIAKKESAWGNHAPVYNGEDCHNYWGYRGKNPVGSGGHTCFESPKDAVDTVAKRIEFLVSNKKLNTPGEMVGTWKCGSPSNCGATGGQAAANKWASDVAMYFDKLNKN